MQRTIGLIASLLVPLFSLPLAAGAAEHAPHGERSRVHEQAAPRAEHRIAPRAPRYQAVPRSAERPAYRAYAPRPAVHREVAPRETIREAPRAQFREPQPRYERHITPRHYAAPRMVVEPHRFFERRAVVAPRRYLAPRAYVAPRRVVIPQRFERRDTFVRYYPSRYFVRAPRRVVFRRYVPQRIFLQQPVQIVRTYVPRPAYVAYAPIYGSAPAVTPVYYNEPVQVPLPITWSPVNYSYNGYPYNGQYSYGVQYPNGNPYANGYNNAPYGMNPFGNAQLQGVVLSNTGGGILLLTPDLKPVFVDTSIAQQNGYVNGTIGTGSFVNVFGYNTGNEFIATALN